MVEADAPQPVELGHMMFGEGGPRCPCGYHGRVEAFSSLPALAGLLGLPEPELLDSGDAWAATIPVSSSVRQELRRRLYRLGLATGNTLNVKPCRGVVVSGWPSLFGAEHRKALIGGVDACLLGGRKRPQVSLAFVPPSNGNDPRPALAFAAFCLACRDGMPVEATEAA